jgi:hypothetical protein
MLISSEVGRMTVKNQELIAAGFYLITCLPHRSQVPGKTNLNIIKHIINGVPTKNSWLPVKGLEAMPVIRLKTITVRDIYTGRHSATQTEVGLRNHSL